METHTKDRDIITLPPKDTELLIKLQAHLEDYRSDVACAIVNREGGSSVLIAHRRHKFGDIGERGAELLGYYSKGFIDGINRDVPRNPVIDTAAEAHYCKGFVEGFKRAPVTGLEISARDRSELKEGEQFIYLGDSQAFDGLRDLEKRLAAGYPGFKFRVFGTGPSRWGLAVKGANKPRLTELWSFSNGYLEGHKDRSSRR